MVYNRMISMGSETKLIAYTHHLQYRKNPKNSDNRKITVIILNVEQSGFTTEYCIWNIKQCRP